MRHHYQTICRGYLCLSHSHHTIRGLPGYRQGHIIARSSIAQKVATHITIADFFLISRFVKKSKQDKNYKIFFISRALL